MRSNQPALLPRPSLPPDNRLTRFGWWWQRFKAHPAKARATRLLAVGAATIVAVALIYPSMSTSSTTPSTPSTPWPPAATASPVASADESASEHNQPVPKGPDDIEAGDSPSPLSIDDEMRAVAFPTPMAMPPVNIGDNVDLYVVESNNSSRSGPTITSELVGLATILWIAPNAITVQVPADQVEPILRAQSAGVVHIVLADH